MYRNDNLRSQLRFSKQRKKTEKIYKLFDKKQVLRYNAIKFNNMNKKKL